MNKINKKTLIYIIIYIIDIALIIYFGKKNYANFVKIGSSQNYYIGGSSRNLIFGKNYITLITSLFFTLYLIVINKFGLKNKINIKEIILILISLLIINCTLFYIFTNKIY